MQQLEQAQIKFEVIRTFTGVETAATPKPPAFATLPKPQSQEDAPIVDFWCGGGGVGTAGFFQAGFQIGINVDCDPKNPKLSGAIADCYEFNFGKPVIRETLQDYADRGGFKEQPKPDVVVFTQSCKNLSRANIGASEDDTDIAVAQAACQGIGELLPSVFVLENVREYKDSICLELITNTLEQHGYRYSHAVLNAWNYGVSQDRERFILIAVRNYNDLATLPFPSHSQPLGWGYAIADLINSFPVTQPAPWQLKGVEGVPTKVEELYLVERTGARDKLPQVRESDRPAWTVKSSIFTDGKGANRQDAINIWNGSGEWRRVTNRGVARLMGLYDWYQLPDAPSVFGPLLGNGLPSEMARAIGEHVKQYLEINPMPIEAVNKSLERFIERRIEAQSDPHESGDRFELINPLEINLERGSQTRITKNLKGVEDIKEKMRGDLWRFDDRNDCPTLIELCEDYLVRLQGHEPFWVRAGEKVPVNGHTRLEAAQELQQEKPGLKMLCRVQTGSWFDVIRLSATSDIESAYPKSTKDRTYACQRFIELLLERYGSLENVPMRGRGRAGADLEEEWGAATLSKMFGLAPNTVTRIYQLVFNPQIADYKKGSRISKESNSVRSELQEQARSLGVNIGSQSLPSSASNLDVPMEDLQAEPITPSSLNKEEETEVSPSQKHAILPIPTTSETRIPETYNFGARADVNLREATRVVVENLHRLTTDELLALEEAIAQAKRSWREAAA